MWRLDDMAIWTLWVGIALKFSGCFGPFVLFKCFFFFFLIHLIGNHLTDVRTGANGAFILNKVEINSEILNNRGKITISIENKGRNTNLPS